MSSRSLAAARARRSGDAVPPVSGNRPITSIGSQAAFAQQMPSNMSYNMPPPANNVRTARGIPPPPQISRQPPQQYQQFYDQNQQQHHQQNQQQQQTNGMPFSKLSISDAIGLITLRLGRVEQWMMDTDTDADTDADNKSHHVAGGGDSAIPDNHKIIDNSVLATIISRIDSLEKNSGSSNTEGVSKLSEEVSKLNDIVKRIGDDMSKHSIELAKNSEQVFRFNRDLTETKDILKSFMVKYDMFAQETTNNFSDYEIALSDLEKRLPSLDIGQNIADLESEDAGTDINDVEGDNNIIMSVDLKNIIKQELANTNA
jgi:hypothetical protein